MSQVLANSSPESTRPSISTVTQRQYDDTALEGVAANTKLLLKLVEDHRDACRKEKNEGRRMLRVATMMTILDNIRGRIQKCQSLGRKGTTGPDPSPTENPDEEKARLKRELASSLAAQKSLQAMCSSLGKEKEIMAAELSRKARELTGMEELIGDLRAQNEALLERARLCAIEHGEGKQSGGDGVGELEERNRLLSDQLLKSLDAYRSMKRKLRASHEENESIRATLDEMRRKFMGSLGRIKGFKEGDDSEFDVREEISELEGMFECFRVMVEKHEVKQGDCGVEPKGGNISARRPSVVA
ncbi:myosin heavy chain-related [Striga hermonthica]|uniref:Myosin heavy chain-related n=1 Tax=Striga hermonthica TaxID=68872 RepID=A0A9N7NBV3_STRHE|nr:myosin heavy chain-related [Striga hermonthica]